jgi:hypothetical protein
LKESSYFSGENKIFAKFAIFLRFPSLHFKERVFFAFGHLVLLNLVNILNTKKPQFVAQSHGFVNMPLRTSVDYDEYNL